MCTQSQPAQPSSTAQALAMVSAGLGYLAGCAAADLGAAAQAEALVGLEQAEAQHTAARARILAAFTAQDGCQADGQYGPRAWLRAFTKITPGAAAGATGWARRLAAHPVIAGALAAGQISASWARQLCDWTGQLPEDLRPDADQILLAAALGGADIHDLTALAREMIERARTAPDTDDGGFADRAVWLQTTIGGAGRLQGDLTPECAASLAVILDALSQRGGPEDARTAAQRRHDALQQACARLTAVGMEAGGDAQQPAQIQIHIDLAALRGLPGGAGLEVGWAAGAGPGREAGWSLARAAAAADPASVFLAGADAEAATCDAVLTPIVSGQIDGAILDQLTDLFLHATRHDQDQDQDQYGQPGAGPGDRPGGNANGHPAADSDGEPTADRDDQPDARRDGPAGNGPGSPHRNGGRLSARPERPGELSPATRQRLRDTLLQMSISLLSGPGGLAACLRATSLGAPYTSLSQPLDVGRSTRTVPPYLRKAVIQRDRHCQFPGCHQPPSRCDAHHLIHWSQGGPTSLGNLRLLCKFHHLIVIHRSGWTLTCHPDGTTTATSPDGRVLHSHGPPGNTA
jgi:hypothetical protein